jgi:hypothetical protein
MQVHDDPVPDMITAINNHLHLYHLYWQPVNSSDDTKRMRVMADDLLEELVQGIYHSFPLPSFILSLSLTYLAICP